MPSADDQQSGAGGWSWKGSNFQPGENPDLDQVGYGHPESPDIFGPPDPYEPVAADERVLEHLELSEMDAVDRAVHDLLQAIEVDSFPDGIAVTGRAKVVVIGELVETLRAQTGKSDQLRLNIAAWIHDLKHLLGDAGLLDDPELSGPLQVLDRYADSIEGPAGAE